MYIYATCMKRYPHTICMHAYIHIYIYRCICNCIGIYAYVYIYTHTPVTTHEHPTTASEFFPFFGEGRRPARHPVRFLGPWVPRKEEKVCGLDPKPALPAALAASTLMGGLCIWAAKSSGLDWIFRLKNFLVEFIWGFPNTQQKLKTLLSRGVVAATKA